MRVWSKNSVQLRELVTYCASSEEKIEVGNYFSAMQFQGNMVDVPYKFKIENETKFIVNIASNARVMYHLL